MLSYFLIPAVGIPVFLFIFWKKLKEDYLPDQIFATATFVISGILLGFLTSLLFLTEWWFWITGLYAFIGLLIGVFRFRFRFYEAFEASFVGLMPWLSLVFFADSVSTTSLGSFVGFGFLMGLLGLYYYLDAHYKNFSWYLSGRVGFSGLTVAGIFFLGRSALALLSEPVVSLSGSLDVLFSAVLAFGLFLLTFNLARKPA